MINIVKEFYANAIEHVGHMVMVRGRPVSFHATAINEYFGLETPSDAHYEDRLPDLDELIVRLCKPGTQWVTRAGTHEKNKLSSLRLKSLWQSLVRLHMCPADAHTPSERCD